MEHAGRCSGSLLAVLYCIAGCQLYWFSPINTVETLAQYNIITGVGFGGGSICFWFGATLLLARQVRCLSEPGLQATSFCPLEWHIAKFLQQRLPLACARALKHAAEDFSRSTDKQASDS